MRHPKRAVSCDRAPRQRGFTLLELVVVIAIIAPMVGLLLPAVQNLRTSRNAAAATATLGEVRAAQAIFRTEDRDGDGVLEFAGSLQELVDAGLLDDDLQDGRRQGYAFETATRAGSGSVVGYVYQGSPLNQGQTGVRSFGGDASGILCFTSDCPPGEHMAIVNGVHTCVPDSNRAAPLHLPLGERSGIAAMDEVNLLADLIAVERARMLLTPEFVDRVKAEFDANDDQHIAFEELLQADLLAMARRLAPTGAIAGGDTSFGEDQVLEAILRRLQTRIRQDLALGTGDETDLVQGLDPAPGAGQMTSPDPGTNRQRKERLLASVKGMFPLWGYRELGPLREALADVRKRADGSPNPGDWVQGNVASQIVARVDATLAFIDEER